MGTYDTIMVPCPKCGIRSGFQSKSGPCLLYEFDLEDAPLDVLKDVMRHGPATCTKCGTVYGVVTAKSVMFPSPEDMKNEYDFSNAVKGKFYQGPKTVKYEAVGDDVLDEILRNAAAAVDSDNFLGYLSSVSQCHHYIASMAIELQQRRAGATPSTIIEATISPESP